MHTRHLPAAMAAALVAGLLTPAAHAATMAKLYEP